MGSKIKTTMSTSLLSFVLLCMGFIHSAVTAQDLESLNDKALDSKDGEYEMRSVLNGYKTKDLDKNQDKKEYFNDPYKRDYFNDPYKREYFNNDPYKREYRGPCCSGWEL